MKATLTQPIVLTAEQLSEYHQKGYIALRGVFSPQEMEVVQQECERIWAESRPRLDESNLRAQTRPHTSGGKVIDRFDPVSDLSPLLKSLLTDERVRTPLRHIFQDDALPFKDKIIFKASGTHGYKIHQDYTYWVELPVPPEALLTVVIAVDAADGDNGAMEFYPGMHNDHLLPNEKPHDIFDPNQGLLPPELLVDRIPEMITVAPGDIIIFGSLVPHQSGINRSGRSRRFLFYSYSAGKYGNLSETYYRNLHGYLRADRAKEGLQTEFR
jgi:ectoine hydroxylase-related dioxygenase (phytanoyl-CoA dioxygenase family)